MNLTITIDDLPFARNIDSTSSTKLSVVNHIINVLEHYNIESLGFAVGEWCNDTADLKLLDLFYDAGHLIGNHSFSHQSIENMTLSEFESDLIKAEKILARWTRSNLYFRFPYLRMGNSPRFKYQAMQILSKREYRHTPVTIDLEDWKFDLRYCFACNQDNQYAANAIINSYVEYVITTSQYYYELAIELLGYSPPHLLLLHMNKLNGDCLSIILTMLKKVGWRFIPPDVALNDSIYLQQSSYLGDKGVSWLHHI